MKCDNCEHVIHEIFPSRFTAPVSLYPEGGILRSPNQEALKHSKCPLSAAISPVPFVPCWWQRRWVINQTKQGLKYSGSWWCERRNRSSAGHLIRHLWSPITIIANKDSEILCKRTYYFGFGFTPHHPENWKIWWRRLFMIFFVFVVRLFWPRVKSLFDSETPSFAHTHQQWEKGTFGAVQLTSYIIDWFLVWITVNQVASVLEESLRTIEEMNAGRLRSITNLIPWVTWRPILWEAVACPRVLWWRKCER